MLDFVLQVAMIVVICVIVYMVMEKVYERIPAKIPRDERGELDPTLPPAARHKKQ